MCATCGCSDPAGTRITQVTADTAAAPHLHDHGHGNGHGAGQAGTADEDTGETRTVLLEQQVLARNDRLAGANREWLGTRGVLAVNLMSSPGSGKTTLLERTIRELAGRPPVSVVEGDQESLIDAQRVRGTGCAAVQINTGAGCHLDAGMLGSALRELDPPPRSVVLIENVGNLVCPALFDLGEAHRVVIMSVTEGADKPLKYPHMFAAADLVLLNKVDLLPHLDFDPGFFESSVRRANPRAEVLRVSATGGEGIGIWCEWLRDRVTAGPGERGPARRDSGAADGVAR
ncbi:hydrogenase nickel incorporation protein HypB [Allosalinactinospora lopnorensis]|uniref:hydrogenase nickel incorporation protein HypB n=1 Tax=Allosalinactinospora lopnorensis TaxID=1352348 RepID=UPI000623BE20|nr:hydrogenase nickel incorporation protein HypB [Allosalinactinospora lopnorensis]